MWDGRVLYLGRPPGRVLSLGAPRPPPLLPDCRIESIGGWREQFLRRPTPLSLTARALCSREYTGKNRAAPVRIDPPLETCGGWCGHRSSATVRYFPCTHKHCPDKGSPSSRPGHSTMSPTSRSCRRKLRPAGLESASSHPPSPRFPANSDHPPSP